jgi:hypothetical protein
MVALACLGCLLFTGVAHAETEPDTVTIQVGKSKVVFLIDNKDDLKAMEEYNFEELIEQFEDLIEKADSSGKTIVIDERKLDDSSDDYLEINFGDGIFFGDRKKQKPRVTNHFHMDFGLNNMSESGSQISSEPYRLDNWGSRYVAFNAMNKVRLGKNKGPANIQFGAELAWNNLMFQDDITIRKIDGQGQFINYLDPNLPSELQITNGIPARKGKMTVATIGLPVLFGMDFGKNDDLKIAAGGYVNYKIASYTKTVFFEDGDREKVKNYSDYGLSDWRYGLIATFSYKGLSIFGKYDLSPLFKTNPLRPDGSQAGDFNVYSFGIRL